MVDTVSNPPSAEGRPDRFSLRLIASRWSSWTPLVAIVGLSLFLNVWGLSKNEYGNGYYAAAARAMTDSWHNFFFVAFDPGGFISVDKPPVFLWIQAASVKLLGFSSWSLLLPSAVAGAAGVALIWLVVKRYFGATAAMIAALVLALTPIAVAVNRINMAEPFYVLALVGAAVCALRSLESQKWLAWTIAAGLLVGVAFNTKMLAGWIPGPAFALAIVVGVEGTWRSSWRRWLPRLAVLALVTFVASISWMLVVDSWPKSDRPYVGGSTDNTVRDLVLSYNGLDRVELAPLAIPSDSVGNQPTSVIGTYKSNDAAGVLRMFKEEHSGQIAWFLPFSLIGGVLSLWRWRNDRLLRASAVLWLGWVLLFGGIFSFQEGLYHTYYSAALAPGVAALAGMGVVAANQLASGNRAWLIGALAMALVTLGLQLQISSWADGFYAWLAPLVVAVVATGVMVFATALWGHNRLPAMAGLALVAGGLLLMPAAWSAHEPGHAQQNTLIPLGGPRAPDETNRAAAISNLRGVGDWVKAHEDPNTRWDLMVTSAVNGALLVVESDLSVMPIGGFSGFDPTISIGDFADLVEAGDVRYVLATDALGRFPPTTLSPNAVNPNTGVTPVDESRFIAVRAGAAAVVPAVMLACESQPILAVFDCSGRAEELRAIEDLRR